MAPSLRCERPPRAKAKAQMASYTSSAGGRDVRVEPTTRSRRAAAWRRSAALAATRSWGSADRHGGGPRLRSRIRLLWWGSLSRHRDRSGPRTGRPRLEGGVLVETAGPLHASFRATTFARGPFAAGFQAAPRRLSASSELGRRRGNLNRSDRSVACHSVALDPKPVRALPFSNHGCIDRT
jgi:hypothetical protein